MARAGDPDGDRGGSGAAAESTGPGRRGGGSDPVFLDDPAAVRAADAVLGRGAADAVSAGSVERGLRGGAVGAGGSGGVGVVAGCDRSSQIGMAGGARALAAPGSLEPTVCLCLGGRDLPSGSAGRREAVRFGVDRGDPGGPEGTAGVPGGVPGERSELAGTPGGSEGAWPHDPPGTGDRGRGSRLLEGAGRELPQDAPPALLGAQDRQRAERVAEGPAAEREAGPAPDAAGRQDNPRPTDRLGLAEPLDHPRSRTARRPRGPVPLSGADTERPGRSRRPR